MEENQTQPSQPTNDLNTKKTSNLPTDKKKLIYLFFGLIFFLLATSAITIRKSQSKSLQPFTSQLNVTPTPRPYNTSTQDDIPKNWKTYTNDFYDISFRYPPEFSPQAFRRPQDPNKLFVLIRLNNNFEYPVMDLSVVTSDLNIEEWIKNKNYCPSSFKSCTSFIPTPIPSSIQFESINRHYTSINTFFKNGAYIFDFSLGAKKPNTPFSNNERGLYNQILSTLKFLGKGSEANLKEICDKYEGVWLEDYSECESVESDKGIDEELCIEKGGIFNECASNLGCRHSDSGKSCLPTAACIKLCNFKSKN